MEFNSTSELRKMNPQEVYEFVKNLPQIGAVSNNWRQRHVSVHQHPTMEDTVITIGLPFNNPSDRIICVEEKSDYTRAINMWPEMQIFN